MATGLLFMIILYFGIGIPIGAVILRAAISLANRFVTPDQQLVQESSLTVETGGLPSDRDAANPFSPPSAISENPSLSITAIPEPSFGRAYLITLVQAIIGAVIGVVLARSLAMAGGELTWIGMIANMGVSFFVGTAVLTFMAPTTFLRGMLVTFVSYLIILAIIALIGGVVFAVTQLA